MHNIWLDEWFNVQHPQPFDGRCRFATGNRRYTSTGRGRGVITSKNFDRLLRETKLFVKMEQTCKYKEMKSSPAQSYYFADFVRSDLSLYHLTLRVIDHDYFADIMVSPQRSNELDLDFDYSVNQFS